jgi:hypothetical protein
MDAAMAFLEWTDPVIIDLAVLIPYRILTLSVTELSPHVYGRIDNEICA